MKLFDSVQMTRPKLNKFDLSHEHKTTIPMGTLIPMFWMETLPGDRVRFKPEIFARTMPLLAPIMHRVNMTVHNFFVPNRLIWDEWEDFITGGRLGTSAPVWPHIRANTVMTTGILGQNTLASYLGFPSQPPEAPVTDLRFSALPFRAYALIFDEYYRDQNLQAALDISKASGEVIDDDKIMALRQRAWEKDYFTSALPFAQRGGDVNIPFGTADVTYSPHSLVINEGTGLPSADNRMLGVNFPGSGNSGILNTGTLPSGGSAQNVRIENIDEIELSGTINDLRRSMRLQEWLEKNARGGARYTEQMLAHFGVRSSDARLQRPEYLGGGQAPFQISEVLSTFQDDTSDPLATMAGKGQALSNRMGFSRRFEEHGIVISMLSVLPKTAYQDGVDKAWSRSDKFDYYFPEFANLGEQEVKNKEVYAHLDEALTPEGTFGYQSRYAEYKYKNSIVSGAFRSTLDFWHMGRKFEAPPALNADFVSSDPTTRIYPAGSVDDNNSVIMQIYNKVDALRPMPYYGTPTL